MKIEAYAKVNLTLEVFAERSDGYHALRSIVQQISLSDTLEITEADGFFCDTGFNDDLCLKAARTLAKATGVNKGASIKVQKRIPVGGGLGGGSADAAAVMIALNEIWGLNKSIDELIKIAALIGSDVPALTLGGTVLMQGRGEKVERLDGARKIWLVLANPGVFSSTKEVYKSCNSRLHDDPKIVYNMHSALECGDSLQVASAMMNDLDEPAKSLHPEIRRAVSALESAGLKGAMVSGSGATVFAPVHTETQGRKIAQSLTQQGLWAECVHTIVR
jgi:4-diphosphocytidyl-2-C-methyl-D-erythritol kinase